MVNKDLMLESTEKVPLNGNDKSGPVIVNVSFCTPEYVSVTDTGTKSHQSRVPRHSLVLLIETNYVLFLSSNLLLMTSKVRKGLRLSLFCPFR